MSRLPILSSANFPFLYAGTRFHLLPSRLGGPVSIKEKKSLMTILTPHPTLPIHTVRELHGRTPKRWLERTFATFETAKPGDIVAMREQGVCHDTGFMTGNMRFVAKTGSGFVEYRLHELAEHRMADAARCQAYVEDDWEIYEEFPGELLEPCEEGGPARFEIIHCRGMLLFLWLETHRPFGTPPHLLGEAPVPGALLLEEETLHAAQIPGSDLGAQLRLCERLGGVNVTLG